MKRILRVLCIEDSERDAELLRRHLVRADYELSLERVETAAAMKAALARQPWDVVLADYSMPQFNGLAALALLKETGLDLPFILISGTIGEELAVEAMRAGAHDYLMKDKLARLVPAIERELLEAENRRARRQAEESLKASEAELRALFAAMTDVILVLDANGRYLKIAPTDPTYLYKPPVSLLGRTLHEVFLAEEAEFFLTQIRRTLAEGQMRRVEYCLPLGGKDVWFEGSVSPLAPDSVIWIARDITERKQVEEALRQSEARLRQSQKMEAIGTLAGGIAHDFNNMLGVIMGCCELVQWNLPPDHAAQAHLAQMLKAGNRAKDLVQQILTFSRRQEHERIPLRLQPILKETLKLLRATLPATIEIRQHLDSQAPLILGDPTQIHQVMMNLGTNAWHAMQEHGGVLTVTLASINVDAAYAKTHAELREGKYIQLVVSDTGHGMAQATLERIYEPFFTTKAPGVGTGLGLAVVHGVVKKHGGAITVQSEPSKGTSFNLYFPVHASAAVPAEPKSMPVINGAGAHILFVDDEEALAALGKAMLEQMGYRVTMQTSAVEALALFRAQPQDFDLVITDQTMPVLSGTELAKLLLELRPELPILLTTGYNAALRPELVRRLGIRELLMKPNTAQSLSEAIHRALANKRVVTAE